MGEKGLRAEKMRLVACYVSEGTPSGTLGRLRENYPHVEFFTSRKALLSAYPETPSDTYLDTAQTSRWKFTSSALRSTLSILAVPFLIVTLLNSLLTLEPFSVAQVAAIVFSVLVWSPFIIEGLALLRTGLDLDSLAGLRRMTQGAWHYRSRTKEILGPGLRLLVIVGGLVLFYATRGQIQWTLGWITISLAALILGTALLIWHEGRKAFPLSTRFPLVPRTKSIHALRASLPVGVGLARRPLDRRLSFTDDFTVEMLDMGGYGIGIVHFDIFSDPEDYFPALGTAPALVWSSRRLAKHMGLPGRRWVTYIASEGETLRVLSPHGTVSPPIPLAEIDAVLPFPTMAWCAPGVRSTYVKGINDKAFLPGKTPLSLPSGYLSRHVREDAFSDPRIDSALQVARRISEQSAYRNFKQIEAVLPDDLVPVAVPVLPQGGGETVENPKAEMSRALVTLMDSSTTPATAQGLAFAMGELIDALSVSSAENLNDFISIDLYRDMDPLQGAKVGMRGAHLLLLGTLGVAVSNQVLPLSFATPEGRVYAVLQTKAREIHSSTLTVHHVSSERGGDDDVDALDDTGQ